MNPSLYQALLLASLFLLSCTSQEKQDSLEDNSQPSSESPLCLDTSEEWERLGSPFSFDEHTPVAPSLILVNDELWLYFSKRANLFDELFLSKSSDGIQWSPPIPITGLEDSSSIKHFNVTIKDDLFQAYLGGGNISEWQSSDGLHFEPQQDDIITQVEFDQWGQLYPVQDPNEERLWYTGFSGETHSIGLATKIDGNWIHQSVVITPDPESAYENTAVAQSAILQTAEQFWMWYGGYDTSTTDPGPWRILLANSHDGIHWEKQGVALNLSDEGEEAWSVREPSLTLWNNQLWMAYIAMGDDGIYRLKLATCS